MRSLRREAIDVLTQLAGRGPVEIDQPQSGVYSVHVNGRWYDAGTVEQALTQAGHAQLDRAAGVAGAVPASRAPSISHARKTA